VSIIRNSIPTKSKTNPIRKYWFRLISIVGPAPFLLDIHPWYRFGEGVGLR
jgi:hypothetical protein